jgi:tRNA-2-methylthio-N6-dimethylallyladenosine synthase
MLKREPYIDLVIGPQAYHKINDTISNHIKKNRKTEETEFDAISKFEYFNKIKNNSGKISSYLTIQEGCDKFCHFCVVPYTRGPEYSRPFKQILDEAKYLADSGTQELILLGQNVNAYNNEKYKLSDLILEIEKYSNIKRIRYTTSHPKDMSDDLIEVYKYSKKLMPLVHLPVQSGSDKVLKLMNRKHTISEYYRIYYSLKKINSDIQFSSDFIIGYPGEEKEDFNATFELIQKIKFINSYSFIFSPRPGTVAADLKLTDKKISMDRLEKIQSQLYDNQMQMNKSLKDKTINVLVENFTDDKTQVFGRSEYMTSVIFNGKKDDIGKIVPVKINKSNRTTLFGERDFSSNQKVA